MITYILDRLSGKVPAGSKRSNRWPEVRAAHLKTNPNCALCGGKANLQVHHIMPFHIDPSLELNIANLITLCEAKHNGINCHLAFGHLGNFRTVNPTSVADATDWGVKIKNRK